MRAPSSTLALVLGMGVIIGSGASVVLGQQTKPGAGNPGPYTVAPNWPQPSRLAAPGRIFGSTAGIWAEAADRVIVLYRGEIILPATVDGKPVPPNFKGAFGALGVQATSQVPDLKNCIVVLDRNGRITEAWTQWDHLFQDGRGPHQINISPYDPDRAVWIIDDMRHQVFKFSNDGKKLLMTLGESGIFGDNDDPTHFRRPTDIAFVPDGSFFISDGYGNTRVLKFDRNGKFVKMWGTRGNKPGQFDTPHAIASDKNGRIYVADRGNDRIQVFDQEGQFIAEWPNVINPYTIRISDDGIAWVHSGVTNEFFTYDLNGKLIDRWGKTGTAPGDMWSVHEFSADPDGNLYVAEVFGGRAQKFIPKPGVDPTKIFRPQRFVGNSTSAARVDAQRPNFAGTWKLVKEDPPLVTQPRGGARALESTPATIVITQQGGDLTFESTTGRAAESVTRKLQFKLDFTYTVNPLPPGGDGGEARLNGPTKTRGRWMGEELYLHLTQGLGQRRDILTLKGNTLHVRRDYETPGGSGTINLTFNKAS